MRSSRLLANKTKQTKKGQEQWYKLERKKTHSALDINEMKGIEVYASSAEVLLNDFDGANNCYS